jgi:hypothetical protein
VSGERRDRPGESAGAKTRPKAPADVVLGVDQAPRLTLDLRHWDLHDYSWDERTGVGRYKYRRREERLVVDVPQPTGAQHSAWPNRAAIDHAAMLARYFEATRVQQLMQVAQVYGR